MIVKRYYAETMAEAMSIIRTELGPDAVILSSKPIKAKGLFGIFKKKQLEVIAAYEPRLESPRAREERETEALSAALRAAKQEPEPPILIPPAPGVALGHAATARSGVPLMAEQQGAPRGAEMPRFEDPPVALAQGTPAVTAPVRAANAYKNAVTTAGPVKRLEAEEAPAPPPAPSVNAAQRVSETNIQQALEAALAARKAAQERRQAEAKPVATPPAPPPQKPAPPAPQQQKPAPAPAQTAPEASREEMIRREADFFIPLNPPEMVILPSKEELQKAAAKAPPAEEAPAIPNERLDALERRISEMAEVVGQVASRIGEGEVPLSDEGRAVYRTLEDNDVEEKLARTLAKEAQDLAPRIGGTVRDAALRVLLREMRESAPLTFSQGERTILIFMGATGVGKTTTLVKLATMCAVRNGLKVGLINTDTYRIAAQEQLRIYADILAVPQAVVYSPAEMQQVLSSMDDRDVVFVDTAGKRPGDAQHREDMKQLMKASGKGAKAMLCVAAPTGSRALKEVIRHYDFLDDYGLILTKADEIEGWGAAVNLCAFSRKNLNYITAGQSVPDDIEEADARVIVERLLS